MKKIADEKTGRVGERLFNFRPCLFAAIFLCLGILFSRLSFVHGYPAWLTLSPIVIPVLIVCIYRNIPSLLSASLLTIAFFVGFCGYWCKAENFTSAPFYDKMATVYGRVYEVERVSDETINLVLQDITLDGVPTDGKIFIKTLHNEKENGRIRTSDLVFVQCKILTSVALSGENAVYPDGFAQDIRFTAVAFKHAQVAGRKFDPLSDFRWAIFDRIYLGMDKDVASVCLGLLLGDTSGMEEGLLENVRAGGVAHIFAVSGLHVGTLFGAGIFLVNRVKVLRERRMFGFAFVALLLLAYGGVCGYSASVLRATVTCLCAYSFKLFGVKRDMIEGLSFAAIVLLAFNPAWLYCAGFQLSFSACYGIAFLAKPMAIALENVYRTFLSKKEKFDVPACYPRGYRWKLFSFLGASFGAQVATAPILLNCFGYLSTVGIILNLIFVPLVGVLFSLTLLSGVIATLLPAFLASYLLYFPNAIWSAAILILQIIAFPVSLEGVSAGFSVIVFYYALLLFCSDKFNLKLWQKKVIRVIFALGFSIAFVLCF